MSPRAIVLVLVAATACGGASSTPPASPVARDPAAAAAGDAHGDHADHAHHGHHADHAHHGFADAERWAQVFDDPARDAWQRPDEVVELLGVGPGLVVADLGAGTGYFEHRLSHRIGGAGKVLALDVEPTMVRYLDERARREAWRNVEARVVAPDDPGLGDASVDRILVVDTWHHLGDRAAYAGKLARALRAGGRIAVVDFTVDADMGPPASERLSPETVVAELTAAGLEASIASEGLPKQYVVIGVRRVR